MRRAHPAKLGSSKAHLGAFGGVAAVALAGALALGGCAPVQQAADMIQPPPVNPSSPIAGYAEQVSRETFPAPNFREVPPKPTDVRSADAYKLAVVDELRMRRELAVWRAAHPDLDSDTDAWADLQRHRIPPSVGTPVSETHDAEAEAFAKRLREEADRPHPQ
jgi:hypothetical protein